MQIKSCVAKKNSRLDHR